jgi:Ca2+:H+ antiporter
MGLEPVEIILLTLTFLVSTVNFVTGRTTVLQEAVHLILFISYVISIYHTESPSCHVWG